VIGSQKRTEADDPGVPEALPRVLVRLRDRLGVEGVDRLWIFPPVRSGRREQGLVAVSNFQAGDDRRRVVTVSYNAEHTGRGVTVEPSFTEEGDATPDRFPRVMEGVVRRGGEEKGEPREVEIGGSPLRFEELLQEFDAAFLNMRDP
jgi:hypothetical protein